MNFATITPPTCPSAWLDLDAVDHNIAIVKQKTANKNLRIASKSVRSVAMLRYVQKKLPNFIGLMSYSAAESLYLLEQGFNDILCAYPQLDTSSIAATLPYTAQGNNMVWMVDRLEHCYLLNEIGKQHGVTLEVCVDINVSSRFPGIYFGTKRSHITSVKMLKKFYHGVKHLNHVRIVGLMAYDAQIAGLPEVALGKEYLAPAIRLLKIQSKRHVVSLRKACVTYLRKQGVELRLINGGGSGSMDFTCAQKDISEVTVGSAFYFPALFSYMDTMQTFTPAAGFVLAVTRLPEKDTFTAHGGGFMASGSVGADKAPVVHYPNNLVPLKDEGFGEVQTPLVFQLDKKTIKPNGLSIADYIWCRHSKAGELGEHFNELIVYRGGQVVDSFSTYRGEGKSFH